MTNFPIHSTPDFNNPHSTPASHGDFLFLRIEEDGWEWWDNDCHFDDCAWSSPCTTDDWSIGIDNFSNSDRNHGFGRCNSCNNFGINTDFDGNDTLCFVCDGNGTVDNSAKDTF